MEALELVYNSLFTTKFEWCVVGVIISIDD